MLDDKFQLMENSIFPCLWFDGDAHEAAKLYSSAFEDTTIGTVDPMVVIFEIKGKKFMGLNGGPGFKPNPSISFFNVCASIQEIDLAWKTLLENGEILMPLDKYPWNEYYGWIQDKYGVSWQLSLANNNQQQPDVFPSLLFTGAQNGRAEEALNFYTTLFENSTVDIIAKYQPGEHDVEDHIKYAQFTINDQRIAMMDSSHNHAFSFSPGVSIVVNCDTQEEIDYLWLNLTEGGREDRCGWCQDAFGVSWQIVPSILSKLMSDPKKAPKVMQAFMKMNKFNIQELEKAAL